MKYIYIDFLSVCETRGRLPLNIDWQSYPDGHCCIKTVPEKIFIAKDVYHYRIVFIKNFTSVTN
ncbi:MAG: hypothetical protein ABI374_05405 [Ginsengibacter sp.]